MEGNTSPSLGVAELHYYATMKALKEERDLAYGRCKNILKNGKVVTPVSVYYLEGGCIREDGVSTEKPTNNGFEFCLNYGKFKCMLGLITTVEATFDYLVNKVIGKKTEKIILLQVNGRVYVFEKQGNEYKCVPDFSILT